MDKLYSVLVVDDEKIILDGMVQTYDWEAVGFTVCDIALSGEEALEKIRANPPDVVMTDIKMKNMDGLTLIRRIQELNTHTECIVISAYRDFEYAQTACDLGAFSYLLKPFADKEFFAVMESMKTYLDRRNRQAQMLDLFHAYQEDIATLQIKNYLLRSTSAEVFIQEMDRLNTEVTQDSSFCCICADIDISAEIFMNANDTVYRCVQFQLFCGRMTPLYHTFRFDLPDNRLLLILYGSPLNNHSIRENLSLITDELEALGYHYYVSYGEVLPGYEGLKESFGQCLNGIEFTYEKGNEKLIAYKARKAQPVSSYLYPKDKECQILSAMKGGDFDELELRIYEFQEILDRLNPGRPFISNCYQQLCLNIKFWILQIYQVEESDLVVYDRLLYNLNTLKLAVREILENFDIRSARAAANAGQYLETAMQYIEEHLDNLDLSVMEVAEALHLNAVYFGRTFKQSCGKSFKEYLLSRRIERAKELMQTTAFSVTQIALSVGMGNLSYFSNQFKKYTGILPSEYRGG